ncbi:MAG: DMT family transporter, partial [Bacteroidales bacterium]|nr:DMT family transporter [Bacteroidales bacterium]
HKKELSLYLSLVLAMLFWGLTFVFYKVAFESFRPVSVILLRLIISVPFIFVSARILRKIQRLDKKDFLYFLILAFFEPFLYFMGESYGLTYVSSTLAAVIVAIIPLLVPLAAYIAFREKLSLMNKAGLVLSFLGVMVVIITSEVEWGATIRGVLLMFLAVLSAVAYALLIKKLTFKYNGFTITAWQNLIGIFFFLPFFFLWDFKTFTATAPSLNSLLALAYLAVFGSSITFILFARGVRELGASRANIFANLIPVFTAIASFFILKEAMPGLKILGIFIVIAGLVLSQIKSIKPRNGKTVVLPPHPA